MTRYWLVSGKAKAQAKVLSAILLAAVPTPIAIGIQEPTAVTKYPNRCFPGTAPVASNRHIASKAEVEAKVLTAILLAAVPTPIAIGIQEPTAVTKYPDRCFPGTAPVAGDRHIASEAEAETKVLTAVLLATIPAPIAVGIQGPYSIAI